MFIKKNKITFLNEKWELIEENIKINVIPRIYEIIYLNNTYYRVVNVVHNIKSTQYIYVIIEKYTDDDIFKKDNLDKL